MTTTSALSSGWRSAERKSVERRCASRPARLTFRSKAIEPVDDDTLRVIGDLSR
jgi:hypothetical protein